MTSVITLRDTSNGASASIAPERGFNLFSFQPMIGDEAVEVLWSAEDFLNSGGRASGSGIPLLFPFPGRLRGSKFNFAGHSFDFSENNDGRGNGIHGLVLDRPWQVLETSGSHAVGRFEPRSQNPPLNQWPADFRLTVSYRVAENTLSSGITIENTGQSPLPWGFGTHPYFRVPLGAGGDAGACIVTVPNSSYWELQEMLPTGRCLPADDHRALAKGVPFRDAQFDDVLTGLESSGGQYQTTIHDPRNRRRLQMTFSESFTQCVVYTPGHRQAICIEPYTCVPGHAAAPGTDPGISMAILPPGGRQQLQIDISVGSD